MTPSTHRRPGRHRRSARAVAVLATLGLVAAACGGDDDGAAEPGPSPETTEAPAADDDHDDDDHDDDEDHDHDDEDHDHDHDGEDHDHGHDDHDHDHDHDHEDHDHDHDDHDHDHGHRDDAAEVGSPEPRLVVADSVEPLVAVIDLATEDVLGSFEIDSAAPLVKVGSEHRIVALVQPDADTIQFLDGGTFGIDHGDHAHYYVADPVLLRSHLDVGRPIHNTAAYGWFTLFADGPGAAWFVEEHDLESDELELGIVPGGVLETGAPHHGGAVMISRDLVAISGPAEGQEGGLVDEIWVFHDGEQVGIYDCPGLHGEVPGGGWAAFACADRILVLEAHGDHAHERVIEYPSEAGDGFRLGYLGSAWGSDVVVGTRGEVLLLADVTSGEVTVVDLPAAAAARSVIDADGNLLVLTADGVLHQFDVDTAELVASATELVTIDESEDAPRITMAGGRNRFYVPVPSEGVVLEFATNDGLRLARTIEVGGSPSVLGFLGAYPA